MAKYKTKLKIISNGMREGVRIVHICIQRRYQRHFGRHYAKEFTTIFFVYCTKKVVVISEWRCSTNAMQ